MGQIILFIMILSTGVVSVFTPIIGIAAYYLLAILGPQYIWWWDFEGLRASLIVALCTLIGIGISYFKKNYDIAFLWNKQNFWISFLWCCIVCSYLFGPYVPYFNFSGVNPSALFYLSNKVYLFYFCSSLELNQIRKIRYLVIVFVVSTIYLTYWANSQYFSQNWAQFDFGRLMGPRSIDGGAIYHDENAFAMLFVTGWPFIYYLGLEIKRKWLRLGLWSVIPLSWHAIFLTGSRGGLVGLIVVLITMLFLSKKKVLALPLLIFFVIFYQWQAGNVMSHRSEMIEGYQTDKSAEDRLMAWTAGWEMMKTYPLIGVGLGSFRTAIKDFGGSRSMVAHNTFVQFAAESGLGAGLAYLFTIGIFFIHSMRIRHWCKLLPDDSETRKIELYIDASTASFTGMIVCSLFLSLNTYEIFFVLLLFNNSIYQICLNKLSLKSEKK